MALFDSEEKYLKWLKKRLPPPGRKVPVGIGDDAAVVEATPGHEWLLTSDFSIEGVHFSGRWHPAKAIGHRALARSLSDIAAMGGRPRFALLSLAISDRLTRGWIEEFYDGFSSLALRYGVGVVGGDTTRTKHWAAADVTVLGEVIAGHALTRSGARPGDHLFVSGRLGLSELGWQCLQKRLRQSGWRLTAAERAVAVQSHLYPAPQCALGEYLVRNRLASAAMDLSDGLAIDLDRLAKASKVGAVIQEAWMPLPRMFPLRAARKLALTGGEDYQLLFTVPAVKANQVPQAFGGVELSRIGIVTRRRQLRLSCQNGHEVPLEPLGYDHFRGK